MARPEKGKRARLVCGKGIKVGLGDSQESPRLFLATEELGSLLSHD